MDFEGQVAVVTGGAQGIGHAVCQELRRGGARIVIWDIAAPLILPIGKAYLMRAMRP